MCDQKRLRLACANGQTDQSLCKSLKYSMTVKLLIEHFLEFLSLKVAAQARLSLHLSKRHIVGNHMSRLNFERGTCIKGQIWPPLEPKTESCFSPISPNWFMRRMVKV